MIFGELIWELLVKWSTRWPKPLQVGCALLLTLAGIALVAWLIWG